MTLEGPLVIRPPRNRDELVKEVIKYVAEKYGPGIVRQVFKPIDVKRFLKPATPTTGGGGALALVALVVLASKKRRR